MGTGASKRTDDGSRGSHEPEEEEYLDQGGGQLYVSLKMENNYKLKKGELLPHVFGSVPLVGSWDASKALSMERESTSMWELSFVVPKHLNRRFPAAKAFLSSFPGSFPSGGGGRCFNGLGLEDGGVWMHLKDLKRVGWGGDRKVLNLKGEVVFSLSSLTEE